MPNIETILLVTLAGLTLSATPGPSMLYVLSRSVGQSISAGIASSIGLAIGGVLLAIGSALGLAFAIQQSELAYNVIRFGGGLYLLYLGIQMIRESGKEDLRIQKVKKQSFLKILHQGMWVELLNPKTILFFVAFIPQFIDRGASNVTMQILILGMLVPLTALPSDIVVTFAGGKLANRLAQNPRTGIFLGWLGGFILIGLGFRIFFLDW